MTDDKPLPADAVLRQAVALHGAGRLEEAEALYRRILRQAPRDPNALNLLGTILIQRGACREAARLIEKAIAAAPRFAQAEHNLGWALQGMGQPKKAALHYRRAIALDPKLAESHNNLGNVLIALGRRGEARAAFEAAVALRPDYALAHCNLGDLLRADGDAEAALAVLRRAAAIHPDHFGVLNNLGLALLAGGRAADAEGAFRRAVAAAPLNAVAHNGLGSALDEQALHADAIAAYRQALELDPGYLAALINMASAHAGLGNYDMAVECCRRALDADPANGIAMAKLGTLRLQMALPDDAVAWFEKALAVDPDNRTALAGAIAAFEANEDHVRAAALAQRLASLDPDAPDALAKLFMASRYLADWSDPTLEARLRDEVDAALAAGRPSPLSVFHHLHVDEDPARNRRVAEAAAAAIATRTAATGPPFEYGERGDATRRLRIGYVSYDFRDHTVGRMIGGSFAQFDRGSFEIVAYGYGRDDGSIQRRRIAGSVDRFRDITADSFAAAAGRIHRDGIDILVDLMGHTHNARLGIFALRPAPIQATWMGMAGTTGARYIDYCIADRTVVDAGNRQEFTEALVRLPRFWRVDDRRFEPAPVTASRAAHGLPEGAFVFASFNSSEKLDPDMFAAWMRILAATPGSVLWCRDDGAPLANLRRRAAGHGVDPSRLLGMERVDHARHLGRLALADLALDTRIVNGHTTTCDTLWAGVPLLTLLGRHMPARVSASALTVLGLPELIATSLDGYEAAAVRLARDGWRLRGLRDRIAAGRATSPLADSALWVRGMERAFRGMWERHSRSEAPASFDVPAD